MRIELLSATPPIGILDDDGTKYEYLGEAEPLYATPCVGAKT